jgi:hypothetical protein
VLSVSWKTDALYDLVEIVDYVEQRNPTAAANFCMQTLFQSLKTYPITRIYTAVDVFQARAKQWFTPTTFWCIWWVKTSLKYFMSFIRVSSFRFDQFQSFLYRYFDCSRHIYCLSRYLNHSIFTA